MKSLHSIDVLNLSDSDLKHALAQHNIALTIDEAKTISRDILNGRAPTLAELILWSIQGSEHCSYKSTKKYLKSLPNQAPHVVIAGKEDAGVIRIATDNQGEHYCLVLSHESHNHPSQIVPFEGAATGVGGNVRDVCCMGAEVVALADSLRFGEQHKADTQWIKKGVVSGIASYGNSIGVPNVAGDAYFHPSYNQNCLVTVVTLGIIKENNITHSYAPKSEQELDLILVGKPTDNSGFGGASFASSDLNEEDADANKGAVQEPNPFLERHLLKASYALFEKLADMNVIDKVGFKDLGAGGIACASVEMAEGQDYGATIYLENVQTSMDNLAPEVILCAETQERFMWAVPKHLTPMILEHYNQIFDLPNVSKNACAKVVGHTTFDGQYKVYDGDHLIIDAPAKSITQGLRVDRPSSAPEKIAITADPLPLTNNITAAIEALLQHPNIRSKKDIYQHYDKQVQGRAIVERGQSPAGVFAPYNDSHSPEELSQIGIALSVAQNPYIGMQDAYSCGVHAVIEACYKVIATGATPLAITDCLCFGNPEIPQQMHALIASIEGIKDVCHQFCFQQDGHSPLPVVAGNVSLYNQCDEQAIPASPMISCVGKINNIQHIVANQCTQANQLIYWLGEQPQSLQNSIYQDLHNVATSTTITADIKQAFQTAQVMLEATDQQLITSTQIVAEGGLVISLIKLLANNTIGADIELSHIDVMTTLFGEHPGFIVTIDPANKTAFETLANHLNASMQYIGTTNNSNVLAINDFLSMPLSPTLISKE